MATKIPQNALTLKQFLQRQQVLGLYRDILRCIRKIPSEADRKQMLDWARADFRKNSTLTDQEAIRMMISYGRKTLSQFQRTLNLSG